MADETSSAATERPKVAIGGLMRCCLETLGTYEGNEAEGAVLPCKWCSSSMIVKDGIWQWNRDGHGTTLPGVSA